MAAPEQDPSAYAVASHVLINGKLSMPVLTYEKPDPNELISVVNLYTKAQLAINAELTDAEIDAVTVRVIGDMRGIPLLVQRTFARAVLAAQKAKMDLRVG